MSGVSKNLRTPLKPPLDRYSGGGGGGGDGAELKITVRYQTLVKLPFVLSINMLFVGHK